MQNLYDSWQINNILKIGCSGYNKPMTGAKTGWSPHSERRSCAHLLVKATDQLPRQAQDKHKMENLNQTAFYTGCSTAQMSALEKYGATMREALNPAISSPKVRKPPWLRHFVRKMIRLPRQARDEHGKS
jgi:hypothetical protein